MEKNSSISVSQIMEEIRDSLTLPDKAYFFDTTLRDGEQTPGISFTLKEKLSIAQTLNDMKIDVISFLMLKNIKFHVDINTHTYYFWQVL